jgi:hypothetical protein
MTWTIGHRGCLQYMPTIGDMYTKDIEVDGAPRHIEIDDTAGQVGIVMVWLPFGCGN